MMKNQSILDLKTSELLDLNVTVAICVDQLYKEQFKIICFVNIFFSDISRLYI